MVVRPASGGIRQHIITLARQLTRKGVTVAIAAPSTFLSTLPRDLAELASFPVEIAGSTNPAKDVLAAYHLTKVIAGGYDLIHSHGLRAGLVTSMSISGQHVPHLVTFHNLLSTGLATRSALTFIASCTQGFIAVSPAIAVSLKAMAPRIQRTVIPNGIPIAEFQRQPGARPSVFELDKNGPTVGCVARLSKEKGVDLFLGVARLIPDVHFLVAGDGPDLAMLQSLAPANVEFAGRVANVRDVYQALDVLVVPSRSEGQGIVALEALASGIPVVASNVGGLAEMLTDKKTALLVPVGDVPAIAQSVQHILHNPVLRDLLIENGRDLVARLYSDDQMLTSTLTVYDSVQLVH